MNIDTMMPTPTHGPADFWQVRMRIVHDCPLGPLSTVEMDGRTWQATVLGSPTRYVIVALRPSEAELHGSTLECVRRELAARAGWVPTENQPKLACVGPDESPLASVAFRVRENRERGWHAGMAASGMGMLATAAVETGSVVELLLARNGPIGRVTADTPAGLRTIDVVAGPDATDEAIYGVSAVQRLDDGFVPVLEAVAS